MDGDIKSNTLYFYRNQIKLIEQLTSKIGEYDLDKIQEYNWEQAPISKSVIDGLLRTIIMNYKFLERPIPDIFRQINNQKNDQVYNATVHGPQKILPFKNYQEFIDLFPKTHEQVRQFLSDSPYKYTKQKIQQLLAFAFYAMLPPMRPSELISLKITTKPTSGNYLNLNDGMMYYTDYKTSRIYGDLKLEVPAELVDILKTYWSLFTPTKDQNIRYIFTKEDDSGLILSNNFTKFFKQIPYIKGITPTDLRNLCVSSLDGLDALEKARIAKYMKHSTGTQTVTYSKYNQKLYPTEEQTEL